ncbi:MAG: LD-carboxypeptidase [Anaerolineaceae bacterium]|nr:LD-carboxypeptidase [Anaerolineaceae bacterium]
MSSLIKAARLEKGMTIGLIAAAYPVEGREKSAAAIELIETLGFQAKPGASLQQQYGYLAGKDAERAADLNNMFADPEVDGIMIYRGGYGSSRLLPLLDYDLIRNNPKMIMGYSDITSLLNGIYIQTGLITFHGHMVSKSFSDYTLAEFKKVLMEGPKTCQIGAPPAFVKKEGKVDYENRVQSLFSGKTKGRLIGGNLSLLAQLMGTPYQPDFEGNILVLEEIDEPVYAVDRYLTQLWLSGSLQKLVGIAFGKFTDCNSEASLAKRLTLEEVFTEYCEKLSIPAMAGLMMGHIEDQTTIPIGCMAELDADAGTLTLLEQAII